MYRKLLIIMKKLFILLIAIAGFGISANAQYYSYSISKHKFEGNFKGKYHIRTTDAYSGYKVNDDGYNYQNQTASQSLKNAGVIPVGMYYITAITTSKGPLTFVLTDDPNQDMYGRDNFRIHGDNSSKNASRGCIILSKSDREILAKAFAEAEKLKEYITVFVYE